MWKPGKLVLPALVMAGSVAIGLAWPVVAIADPPFSRVVVFGDSLSDAGNMHLASGGLIAGEPYFAGRFSNGPVWVDRLAEQLGLPSATPFMAGGANHAWGSAQTGGGFSPFGVPNVGTQIDVFLAAEGPLADDELIVVLAGGNDALLLSKSPWAAARNMTCHVAKLADSGGEVFVVPTLLPVGQTPLLRGTVLEPLVDLWVLLYNDALERRMRGLQWALGIEVVLCDVSGLTETILDDPATFGFSNVVDPACPDCCIGVPLPGADDTIVPDPDSYLWWDFIHPTRVLHQIWGDFAVDRLEAALAD